MRENAGRLPTIHHLTVTFCLFLLTIPSVFGAIEIESVEFGFDGYYKRGRWAPLQLLVVSENEHESFAGDLELEVTNLFSEAVIQTYSTPVSLTRTDRRRYTLHVFQPGTSTKLTLRIVNREGQVRVEREIIPDLPKETKDLFVLALTPPGRDVFDDWHGLPVGANADSRVFVVHPASQRHLPHSWKHFDSIDLVVIRGISLAPNRISSAQQSALLDWVRNGGSLLLSGGSNLRHLHGSFLEPLLPVHLGELRPASHLPEPLTRLAGRADISIDLIGFKLKDNAEKLGIGSDVVLRDGSDSILASRRSFGSGQIVSLAFDYEVLPISQSPERVQLWSEFIKTVGKSPRHLDDRYEQHQRDAEKIHKVLKSLPSGRVPLFRILPLFLLACLLGFGGFTWWLGTRVKEVKYYWIGSILITVFLGSAAVFPKHILSIPVSVSRLSILSVYSEGSRAHLRTYIGAIASAHSTSSVLLEGETYIRPLKQTPSPPIHVTEARSDRICDVDLSAWQSRTFRIESFFEIPAPPNSTEWTLPDLHEKRLATVKHHLPGTLESAGVVYNGRYMQLGSVSPNTAVELKDDFVPVNRTPSLRGLTGKRKQFAQILASEGILQYILEDAAPKLVGWIDHSFLPMKINQPVETADETFVIMYLH